MRVKIGYTVDIEEVETEVQELFTRALYNLEEALDASSRIHEELSSPQSDIETTLDKMEETRKILIKADSTVSDCYEILKGYLAVLQQAEEEIKNEEL